MSAIAAEQQLQSEEDLLDRFQRAAFGYFWTNLIPQNGLVVDTTRTAAPARIAVMGLMLASYLVANPSHTSLEPDQWSYLPPNFEYVLIGYLIEKISGQTYSQFVQEKIFKPLEMQDSGYDAYGNPVFNQHFCDDESQESRYPRSPARTPPKVRCPEMS